MKLRFSFFSLLFIVNFCHASEGSLKSVGLETTNSSGCYLTDGKNMVAPTISLMVEAYGEHPKLSKERILKIIEVAVKAGCDINAPDSGGLSPLNASILFNKPELISFLLLNGANPRNKISSKKEYLNGLDSYQLLNFLMRKDKTENRDAINAILSKHNKNS